MRRGKRGGGDCGQEPKNHWTPSQSPNQIISGGSLGGQLTKQFRSELFAALGSASFQSFLLSPVLYTIFLLFNPITLH